MYFQKTDYLYRMDPPVPNFIPRSFQRVWGWGTPGRVKTGWLEGRADPSGGARSGAEEDSGGVLAFGDTLLPVKRSTRDSPPARLEHHLGGIR
jgi:hypothetical protein